MASGRERGAEPLAIKDCTLTALATGEEARNLRELLDRLRRIPAGSLYYHFWGRLLRPTLEEREYVNDFANWVGYGLRDPVLAERLALIDPGELPGIEALRRRLVDLVEERIQEMGHWSDPRPDGTFHFIRGKIVVFDTGQCLTHPRDLVRVLPSLSDSSVFYHLIDARTRSGRGMNDFQRWLLEWGEDHRSLAAELERVDIYHTSLDRLRQELTQLCARHLASEAA